MISILRILTLLATYFGQRLLTNRLTSTYYDGNSL